MGRPAREPRPGPDGLASAPPLYPSFLPGPSRGAEGRGASSSPAPAGRGCRWTPRLRADRVSGARGPDGGPRQRGAAAGGLLVSALTASPVRVAPTAVRPSGVTEGRPRGESGGAPQLYPESSVSLPHPPRRAGEPRPLHSTTT